MGRIRSDRFLKIILIGAAAGFAILAAVFAWFKSPWSPVRVCTLMGCTDSLEISFYGNIPDDFTVMVISDDGDMRIAACTPSSPGPQSIGEPAQIVVCSASSITFFNYSPREVTVVVDWQGGSYTTSSSPRYADFRPNGPFCAPVCQSGSVEVKLP